MTRPQSRPRSWWRVPALVAALAALAGPAAAQATEDIAQLSLEELMAVEVDVVYGASRYQQKTSEAPASVTVVTGEQIREHGYRTLAEVLAGVAGFHFTSDRNYTYAGARGFSRPGDYSARVLLMVDGHRMNDSIYDQALVAREFPIELSLVDRVEVIRGPNAALYGTGAFLAVVNVVTKDARKLAGLSASASIGSLGARDAEVSFGGGTRGYGVRVAASRYASDGNERLFFPEFAVDGSDGVARHADREETTRLFASVARGGLTLTSVFGSRTKHVPTASYETIFNDPRLWTRDAIGYLDGQYVGRTRGYTLMGRVHVNRYAYDGAYPLATADGTGTWISHDLSRGTWWGAEGRLISPAGRAHRASLGFEYVGHLKRDQWNDDETGQAALDDRRHSRDWAVYAQDHYRALDQLAVDVSLRFDSQSNLHRTLSPRVALVYDPLPATTLKAIYGRVFRFPNAYERYYRDVLVQKPNPGLGPETVNTWELLLDRRLGRRVRVAVGGYLSVLDDLIETREDPADGMLLFDNLEGLTMRGLEAEAELKDADGVPVLSSSYSFQHARFRDAEGPAGRLTNSPRHLVKLGGALPLPGLEASVAGELQFMSRRWTLAGNRTDPAWLANVTVNRRGLLPGLDAAFRIRNLLNRRHGDPASGEHVQDTIEQDGRTVEFRLTYRLGR